MTAWLVVVNWNGKFDTLDLLSSLAGAELPDTTVLVVDNGSSDDSVPVIRTEHPWVEILETGSNLGFAGGNNAGIRYALDRGAQIVGVLNNDTTVRRDFWPPLLAVASRDRTAVSPDIRYSDAPGQSWFYGGTATASDGVRHLQQSEQPPRDGLQRSQILTGCCMVASATTWQDVGEFDERLFLIFEDADWSMRAARMGVELLLQPASLIEHKVSRSFRGPQGGLGLYYFCRNGLIFATRWLGLSAAVRFGVRRVLAEGLRAVRNEGWPGTRTFAVRMAATVAATTGRRGRAGAFTNALATTRQSS